MIDIKVDEGYAFDYLSILNLKCTLDPESDIKQRAYDECKVYLKSQLGNKFDDVFFSNEYNELYIANYETFKAVDLAKTDSVKASDVDRCNYTRFMMKKKIQDTYFGGEMYETKTGYSVYKEDL